ncbi:MAG: hypothetical protein U0K92_08325 [Treponema sp.]|nr:hypothetical protein [Treponema sp.]
MSESIITGLFTLSGIIITSIISIIVQKIQIKANDISRKMDRSISDMIDDLEAFSEIEKEYINEIINLRTKNGETKFVSELAIKKEFRSVLREKEVDLTFSPSDIKYYRNLFNKKSKKEI